MPEIELDIGAKFDISSSSDVEKVGRKIDDLDGYLKSVNPKMSIWRDQRTVTSTSTSVQTYLDLGGPSQGRAWSIRRLVFSNPTPWSTALATPVVVFVSGKSVPPDLTDQVDFGVSLPVAFNYGRGENVIQYPEHVIVGVTAGTVGQVYIGIIRAEEFDQRLVSGRVI